MTPRSSSPAAGSGPQCHDAVCVTCSDSAVAVRVKDLLPDRMARVSTEAGTEEISIALVDAHPGDLVLVHAAEAIAVLERRPS
jgi:hydrogenase maturation factor